MVKTEVNSEDPITGKNEHCCTAYATLVTVDGQCQPRTVPALIVENEKNKQAWEEGLNIRKNTMSRREAALKIFKEESKAAIP